MPEDLIIEAKEFFELYKQEIGKYAKKGKKTIQVSFQDIASFSHILADQLLLKPEEVSSILELALEEIGLITKAKVRLSDLPKSQHLLIREIRAKHLGQLIVVEGIVRQASDVRPQIVNAKFECPSCGTVISVLQIDKHFKEPMRCSCGRRTNFKLVSKEMVDAQRLVIEESPESLKGGEQPRRLNIFLKEDLVEPRMEERTTPGSKVMVVGVLKEVPIPLRSGAVSTRFDLAIEANNVIPLEETFEELEIDEEEERQIRELASDPDIYKKITASIAPSIFGYEQIKFAIALQLLGGVRKQRSDGTWSRGDMHVLLVGDPGVAKSVMLKFVSSTAPKGRYVVGKAATQAGITATVVRDEYLRGWALEAGAMVLANKGIACLDEMEKMAEQDRSAMHEAMEQQTVTISKANVQATLRAETSVLGAANPKFGRFNPYEPIAKQIEMSPTLLNRFDLIFTMKDIPERMRDEAIATHVLLEHRKAGEKPPIDPGLFKKYVAYAKQKIKPQLSEKAVFEIKKFYVDLRNAPAVSEDVIRPIPISARQLEALIRLSEASARARLSKKITKDDAKRAIQIMHFCLLQVGMDTETGAIDIDRIATGIPASERGRIVLVREALVRLESRLGKLIPVNDLKAELSEKISEHELDEIIDRLKRSGDIFQPKKGFVQRI
ncbi:MAG: minichromosome maintenance protein MCM [Candidatus Pacearchaeota archaeon]|nr:MAG: minichromosome maintenance protein MCM [Candidatus Pacearchaeota archaeon]